MYISWTNIEVKKKCSISDTFLPKENKINGVITLFTFFHKKTDDFIKEFISITFISYNYCIWCAALEFWRVNIPSIDSSHSRTNPFGHTTDSIQSK